MLENGVFISDLIASNRPFLKFHDRCLTMLIACYHTIYKLSHILTRGFSGNPGNM